MPRCRAHALLALLLPSLLACGASPRTATPASARFVNSRTGETMSRDDAIARLIEARLVFVGERHDRPEDHAVQAQVAAHAAVQPGVLALGFEMFARPFQSALDAYAGGGSEEALLRDTEWETRWGFDFAMYRPLLELGQQERVDLHALNAPRELTRAIARNGMDSLDEADRASLTELNLEDPEHRAMIEAAFAGHPHMDAERLERFYAAQVVWDETMAAAVHDVLSDAPAIRMLVFAGVMHVQPSAIPRRAARRGAPEHRVLMPVSEAELEEALAARSADVFYVTAE